MMSVRIAHSVETMYRIFLIFLSQKFMISLLKYGKEFAWYQAKKTLSLVIVTSLDILLIIYWYFTPNSSSGGFDA